MTDSIEQRRKDIKETRNKLSQLQICKMKKYMNVHVNLENGIMMHLIVI